MSRRVGVLVVLLTWLAPSAAFAQNESSGVGLRIVPGIGFASASFGDDSPRSSSSGTFTLGALFLFPISSKTDITVEATWRPIGIDNPHFDESFSSVYLLGGVEFGGESVYFRPSLGVDFQFWSGAMAGTDTGTAAALELALGFTRPIGTGRWHIAPEASVRFSVTSGLSSFVLLFSFGVGVRS